MTKNSINNNIFLNSSRITTTKCQPSSINCYSMNKRGVK